MIIRKPAPKDLPALSALWQEAFGDSQEDVTHFYETAFSYDRALIAEEQNPVAGIYWIDAKIKEQKVAYLYALAVRKDFRNKGIGKALLQKVLATVKAQNYAGAILVPGEESLYAYYEKIGFVPFGKTEKTIVKKAAPGLPVEKVSPEIYFSMRQKAKPDVQWGTDGISYLGSFCNLYAGEDCLLAAGREGAQEYIGKPERLPSMLYTLNISELLVSLPGAKPCAMGYFFAPVALPDIFGPTF